MKWKANHIVEFLKVYQHYPMLWNTKDKNYGKTKLKIEYFERLFSELDEKQLIGGMDMKQLKARIKSIKDVYRQQLSKIEKSKKSGCGPEDVYSPSLAWFDAGQFLAEVLASRSSKANWDVSQNSQESVSYDNRETCWEFVESGGDNCPEESFNNKPPAKMRPPATPMKRFKKRASEKSPSEISAAIHQLDKIAQNAAQEKPYDEFGKFVASELRQLPQRQAILLQQEIQNCIIRSKLACLDHVVVDCAFSSSSNLSIFSNNDNDVLQQ